MEAQQLAPGHRLCPVEPPTHQVLGDGTLEKLPGSGKERRKQYRKFLKASFPKGMEAGGATRGRAMCVEGGKKLPVPYVRVEECMPGDDPSMTSFTHTLVLDALRNCYKVKVKLCGGDVCTVVCGCVQL